MSLTAIAKKFNRAINTIRARFDRCGVTINPPGGANNTKLTIDQAFIDDVIALGVRGAAKKYNLTAQTVYQRLYYKYGMSVKDLKQRARQTAVEEESQSLLPDDREDGSN